MSRNANARKIEYGSAAELLLQGHTIQIAPEGFSMYPLIYPGRDEVILSPAQGKKLKRCDVVLFRRGDGALVLHRITRTDRDGFYMTGDNARETDGPIAEADIYGIMTAFYHKGHYFKAHNLLYRASVRIWLILLPVRGPISDAAHKIKNAQKH